MSSIKRILRCLCCYWFQKLDFHIFWPKFDGVLFQWISVFSNELFTLLDLKFLQLMYFNLCFLLVIEADHSEI